jgi:hypothetical protein
MMEALIFGLLSQALKGPSQLSLNLLLELYPRRFPPSERQTHSAHNDHKRVSERNRLHDRHLFAGRKPQIEQPSALLVRPLKPLYAIPLVMRCVQDSHSSTCQTDHSEDCRGLIMKFIFI